MKIHIQRQRSYSRETDEQAFSVVRIRNEHIKKMGGAHQWVKISNPRNQSIYRMVRGAGSIEIPADALELDYEGFRSLNSWSKESPIGGFYVTNLIMTKASRWEAWKAHWFHPNPAYSAPMRLGYIGLVLGVLGFAMSVLSLLIG